MKKSHHYLLGSQIGFCLALAVIFGCSILATRPVQLMSDTSAAIRAAKEVQADTLAPELYRQANEWFFKAKREYKFKNFALAKEYAEKARNYAEQAEFESLRNGGSRTEVGGIGPLSNTSGVTAAGSSPSSDGEPGQQGRAPASAPEMIPTPQGTPAEEYDQRKQAEDEARRKAEEEAQKPAPSPAAPPLAPTFFPPARR